MADNTVQNVDDDLDLKPAQATAMFRLEMFATNFLLGYWKQLVAVVVVVLVTILAWGQYRDIVRRNQRETVARIAETMIDLPAPLPILSQQVAMGQPIDVAKVEPVADALVAIGNGANRTARVEAYLTAAELYRLANLPDKQRSALASAVDSGRGVLDYSAEAALANLDLAQGQGDAALERLRDLAASSDGYLAERAQLDLASALEHLGRKDEAIAAYDTFVQEHPESPRKALAESRRARVADGGAAAPTPPAAPPAEGTPEGTPAEGTPAEGAPTDVAPAEPAPAPGAGG